MSIDKTLADVQPGGRVRLGDRPEIFAAFRPDGSLAGTAFSAEEAGYWGRCKVVRYAAQPSPAGQGEALPPIREDQPLRGDEPIGEQHDARMYNRGWNACREAAAALSAQPSPGGQDAQRIVVRVPGVGQCTLTVNDGVVEIPAQTIAALAARQPVGEPVAWLVHWSDMPLESPEVTRSASRISEVSALTNPPRIVPLYAAPPAQAVAPPYSLDADPAGIRALVADAITGTLWVGAQGHMQPPAGHWMAPFWDAAHADARVLVKVLEALGAAAKSLRTIASSTKDTEFLGTACEVRAYANSRASCAEQALADSQAVGK